MATQFNTLKKLMEVDNVICRLVDQLSVEQQEVSKEMIDNLYKSNKYLKMIKSIREE